MSTATSSSDRLSAAKKALAKWSQRPDGTDFARGQELASALRALIEPPATDESPEQYVDSVMERQCLSEHQTASGREVRRLLTEAFHAGIDAAWESWEPDDHAPTLCANCGADVPTDNPAESVLSTIAPSRGGIFRNDQGDTLIEPVGDDQGELILVRADGTTATLRGEWETGWEA